MNIKSAAKKLSWKKYLTIGVYVILVISIVGNACLSYALVKNHKKLAGANAAQAALAVPTPAINENTSIAQIEPYLDSISTSLIADETYLAKEDNVPSLGCGPSSYSLAKILDQKFFNNKLKITAAYTDDDPTTDEIVERFGLHEDAKGTIIDHAWLEIYYQDKFLFIDPTIAQFGTINRIAYQVFDINDANISSDLKSEYGIVDIRLSRLVQKEVNRIPTDQEPYPGVSISQDVLNYYIEVEEDRNDVNDGKEPADWTTWDQYLISRYA
jgi:hypothetical protein